MEKPHRELDAWQLAMELVEAVYEVTEVFPSEERFELTRELRRTALSVPSNVAEGADHESDGQFLRYARIARASLSELDTQFEVARRLDYMSAEQFEHVHGLMDRTDQTLSGLIRHLKRQ